VGLIRLGSGVARARQSRAADRVEKANSENANRKFPATLADKTFRVNVCDLTGIDSKSFTGGRVAASELTVFGEIPVIPKDRLPGKVSEFIGLGSPLTLPGRGPEEPRGSVVYRPVVRRFLRRIPPTIPPEKGPFPLCDPRLGLLTG